ncbi:hypothetical protein ACQY0O_007530 [Thecaphora frezii]
MAIFGKKKSDKDKSAGGPTSADSVSSLSPTLDGSSSKASGSQVLREGSKIPGSAGGSHHMGGKGSLSGSGSAGVGSGFAGHNGAVPQPSQIPGPPGAASGFKFGGPPSRPDVAGNSSGIPAPSSTMRARQVSDDSSGSHMGYGMAGMGAGGPIGGPSVAGVGAGDRGTGLPPSSSGPGIPLSSNGIPPASASGAGGPPNDKLRSQQVVYPWSQRSLVMNPPRFLDESRQVPPGALSPFPFPRYGHAANQIASPNGEIYLFGGLVRESVKNDLYTVYVDKLVNGAQNPASPPGSAAASQLLYASATLVQTTGEIPPPRVGHATVLVSNVLILWGGDTKVRADDKQDEGLYLLNLSTREWTRVKAPSEDPDTVPVGRYGHSVAIVGSKFYVFAGQVDGTFMNDLWSFDLNSLKGTPTWERVVPASDLPPKRTGHASVTYKDKIFIFGGTDGQYHYNDTWCYDVATNTWKELSCIGYIPVPREGHATCLVDDVMYIFGGRGVDGKDLGDLASFKISNQRWYMFANMGPSPSGRSGHALAAYQNKVVVLGGESFTGVKPDDPAMIHVLDTAKIKYPPDNPSQRTGSNGRKSSLPGGISAPGPQPQPQAGVSTFRNAMSPVSEDDTRNRATSPTQRGPGGPMRSMNGFVGSGPESPSSSASHHMQQQRQTQPMVMHQQTLQQQSSHQQQQASQLHQQQQQQQQQQQHSGMQSASQTGQYAAQQGLAPAQAAPSTDTPSRAMSSPVQQLRDQRAAPLQGGPGAFQLGYGQTAVANQQQSQPFPHSQLQQQQPQPEAGAQHGGLRSPRSNENVRGAASSPTAAPASTMRNLNGAVTRNESPAQLQQDSFHYGRVGTPTGGPSSANSHQAVPRSVAAELEAMRKREAWLKAALAMAAKKGFVEPEQLQMADGSSVDGRSDTPASIEGLDTGPEGSDKDRIFRALVSLKTQLAGAKATIAQQVQAEADRMAEADRARSAALQEAAYYRAKLAALEAGNATEVARLDKERAAKFEKSLAEALRESAQLERQVSSLREQAKLEQQLRNSAEERLSETAKRAMAAEAAQMKAYDELLALQKRSHASESSLREHAEQVATLSSIAARHKADHEQARSQLEMHRSSVDQHLQALVELQAAHTAVQARAADQERLHAEQRSLAEQHATTIAGLRAQLEAKTQEAHAHSSRSAELEALVAQHRQEAEKHRAAVSGSLATLLSQKDRLAATWDLDNGDRAPPHVEDKMRALEEEAEALRELHGQAKQMADAHSTSLQEMQERNLSLEKQHLGLRSELSAMRSQLAVALQEVARLKDISSSKDLDLRDRNRAIEAAQVKASLLRQFMADRGVAVPNDDELSVRSGYADRRIRELEEEIDARTREVQDAEHRLQDSESRVEELTRELEHQASRRASRGGSGADGVVVLEAQERARRAEEELAETTASYKERMTQLENDYQTAVQFVKGTEKMLRRMKDELTKYKTENAQLQSEIAALRSGQLNASEDGGAASEEAARDIEALRHRLADVTQQSEEIAAENRELERRIAVLVADQHGATERAGKAEATHMMSNRKVNELQSQVERLEVSLSEARKEVEETLALNQHLSRELSGNAGPSETAVVLNKTLTQVRSVNDQLKRDNASLNAKCAELEDKEPDCPGLFPFGYVMDSSSCCSARWRRHTARTRSTATRSSTDPSRRSWTSGSATAR